MRTINLAHLPTDYYSLKTHRAMSIAIYIPYTDQYDNQQPDIHEEGLQYVSEADEPLAAHAEFCEDIGIDASEHPAGTFAYVELPEGASSWSNERVLEASRDARKLAV